MCKKVEEVLAEGVNAPVKCEVVMDGVTYESDDFVCIMSKENGDTGIYYNTDALTLGIAMKMVAKAFVDSMAQLSEEERASVQGVLSSEFEVRTEEDAHE